MHLPGLALPHRRDYQAGATKDDLPPGPAVDWELKLPFSNIVRPRQLDPLRILDALGFSWKQRTSQMLFS